MKRWLAMVLLLVSAAWCQTPAPAAAPSSDTKPEAAKNEPPFELEHFYLAIMRPAKPYAENVAARMLGQHNEYWQKFAAQGGMILAGPVAGGDNKIAEVAIYRAATEADARRIGEDDPAVQLGLWTAEIHPWMTMKGALKPISRYVPMRPYFLGLLLRGPNFSPAETPERQKIQEGHMANMKRLSDLGKLVAGGPFEEDGDLRGIFVFKVGTLEEAQELTNTDPAVQSGRLKIALYQWKLPGDAFRKN